MKIKPTDLINGNKDDNQKINIEDEIVGKKKLNDWKKTINTNRLNIMRNEMWWNSNVENKENNLYWI